MRIRILFQQPEPRASFIGNEIEGTVTFDVESGVARGFFGSFTELPADPTQPAVRHTSTPFEVRLEPADLQALAQFVLQRAAEQGVGGMAPTSTVRID
jgi:hypothetical protein